MILAIETSTPTCSVALSASDGSVYEKRESGRGIHSEKLFEFTESLLSEHSVGIDDIDELLLSSGPGSYTGLRIGSAAVKGLLFRRNTRLFLLGTLEAMAVGVAVRSEFTKDMSGRNRVIHSVIDARRQHLYYQRFEFSGSGVVKTDPTTHMLADIETMIKEGDTLTGTGIDRLNLNPNRLDDITIIQDDSAVSATHLISARNHARFRDWFRETDPSTFEPDYLAIGQTEQ